MHNIKLTGILRYVSMLIISLLVFLYFIFNTLTDYIVPDIDNTNSKKEYEYRESPVGTSIPEFTYNLESLFPRKLIPAKVETIIEPESIPFEAPPSLQFVGMIETDEKTIYSFRKMDTNKLMLFEEEVVLEGTTLIAVEVTKYTFKKNEIIFQVDKK